jgi:hypothetical protein
MRNARKRYLSDGIVGIKEKSMSDIRFVPGLSFFKPHSNAPEFVLGTISIRGEQLVPWLRENHKELANDKGYINLAVKVSKSSGKPYVCVDTYKKKPDDGDY